METSISQDEYTCAACPEGSDDLSGIGLSCTDKGFFTQYMFWERGYDLSGMGLSCTSKGSFTRVQSVQRGVMISVGWGSHAQVEVPLHMSNLSRGE